MYNKDFLNRMAIKASKDKSIFIIAKPETPNL